MKSFRLALATGVSGALLALSACVTDGTAEEAVAEPLALSAAACTPPPTDRCTRGEDCGQLVVEQGTAVNPDTGRNYYLDYSCDLTKDDKVTIVLNLHGGGSYGNWTRHYFPIMDHVQDYKLVVATPNAPIQFWTEKDDAHLEGIISSLIDEIGAENVNALWLAGHSQGSLTSRRLVCTPYWADKVDGYLSLSGGRVSRAELAPNFFRPGMERRVRPSMGEEVLPTCDFHHIYTTGEREIVSLPETSRWAEKYSCDARTEKEIISDAEPGYVFDSLAQEEPNLAWGLMPSGGDAEKYVYPNCDGDKLVADVVRLKKGHTEGLEPNVTAEIVRMMVAAPGGKISGAAE